MYDGGVIREKDRAFCSGAPKTAVKLQTNRLYYKLLFKVKSKQFISVEKKIPIQYNSFNDIPSINNNAYFLAQIFQVLWM